MKILLLNYNDAGGGAAKAALKLTQNLNEEGIDATLGVVEKKTSCPFVIELPHKKNSLITKVVYKILKIPGKILRIFYKKPLIKFSTTNNILHSTNLKSIIDVNWINNSDYDLVNLHWINADMISIKDISKINKPICWTLHDSWAFCGAEHHPNILENDQRYKTIYTKKNTPKTSKGYDVCKKVWKQKHKYLSKMNITFTAPSIWEKNCLNESYLFSKNTSFLIHNLIDTNVFYPKDKIQIRKIFNIPENKKVIGFGAAYSIDDPKELKGGYYLLQTLNIIENPEDYFLIIFGPATDSFLSKINIPYFATGYISNEVILSSIYNACDVFLNPSIIESMSYTCLEATCCEVPSVAFNVSGIPDVVTHQKTGYLANPYDVKDLYNGLLYCLENKDSLKNNCHLLSEENFNTKINIAKYIHAFNETITKFSK